VQVGSLYLTVSGLLSGPTAVTGSVGPSTLELHPGFQIVGNVFLTGRLILGGTGTDSFDIGKVGSLSQFSGFTSLIKNGNSTWTLTGTGTFNGPIDIDTGTLVVSGSIAPSAITTVNPGGTLGLGNGGSNGSIVGNVLNNGTLTFDRSDTYTFDGVISGSGALHQIGAGTTILTATNSYTGPTTVDSGVLLVNGSIASSSVTTVNPGGALGGVGTIGNTQLNAGGIFAPGAPGQPGTSMRVAGNLAFQSGAIYLVQVNPTTSTIANVTGMATLGGNVLAAFAPGSYVTRQYDILHASGITGSFAALGTTNLPPGFAPSLSYTPTDVFLNLTANLGTSGLSSNQRNVATGLNNFFNGGGTLTLNFLTIFGLSGGNLSASLTQLSGELGTGPQQATFNAMTQFLGVMTDPMIDGRGDMVSAGGNASSYADENALAYTASGERRTKSERDAHAAMARKAPPMVAEAMQRWSAWAAGFGGTQTTDGDPALGSNTATSRIYGGAVGADYRFSPDTLAGVAVAGGGTSFSVPNSGIGRSDLFQAGAFVRHAIGAAYLSGALAYGWQNVTTNRTVTLAGIDMLQGCFNANALSGRGEAGYRFVVPGLRGFGLTPYAAGQFTTFWLPAYAEQAVSGANTFALAYGARTVTDRRSELGFRSDKSYAMQGAILTLRGREAWVHDFNADRSIGATFVTLPGASFVVNGAAQPRDAWLSTTSAELKWMNGWSVAGVFESEYAKRERSYAGKGVVRYQW
jgi:autotransporter-associated beta strand protein